MGDKYFITMRILMLFIILTVSLNCSAQTKFDSLMVQYNSSFAFSNNEDSIHKYWTPIVDAEQINFEKQLELKVKSDREALAKEQKDREDELKRLSKENPFLENNKDK